MSVAEPVVHGKQPREVKPRWAALAVAGSTNEPRPLEHLEVLGDGRLCEGGRFCELHDTGLSRPEALEDRSACGISEGREGEAEGVVDGHYQ